MPRSLLPRVLGVLVLLLAGGALLGAMLAGLGGLLHEHVPPWTVRVRAGAVDGLRWAGLWAPAVLGVALAMAWRERCRVGRR